MNILIGSARAEHLAALQAIELASFETLRSEGAVAGSPAAGSMEEFSKLLHEGLLLAAFIPGEIPVGFAGAFIVDNWLHIAEADVHPIWQRQGIGRQLMNALLSEGKRRGLTGASLTTDRYAPFNAPFYASLGFQIAEGKVIQPRLRELLTAEVASGLNPQRRVAMQLFY
ncbi:GNAT family N-acetyltransferase [Pantoea sp. FN0302]|uniref:GNAT family N-acetyltransferase n=1 Tax=Pantoea sp. FN0302 TaxID=3418558 RepID=UPI003CFB035A